MPRGVSSRREGVPREPADTGAIGDRALWFGLFGAPFFWSVQLIITYALAAHTCYLRQGPLLAPASPAARAAACAVIVAALGGCAAATMIAIRNCREARLRQPGAAGPRDGVREGRTRFMAYSGVLLGVLFTGAVVPSGLALLLLPVCW